MFLIGSFVLLRRIAILKDRGQRLLLSEYLGVEMLIACLLFIAVATVMIYLLYVDKDQYCHATIWICILLYTSNKIFLYLYLIEKAHVVNCALHRFEKRGHSALYLFNMASISLYAVVITLMIVYRKSEVENGECSVGLKDVASSTLLIFDSIYRSYLMTLFIWPLVKNAAISTRIMDMAKKNVFGSIMSLLFSSANIGSILFMHGNQMASMCLFLCMLDVFVDVLIMDWLLTTPRDKPLQEAAHDLEVVKMDSVVTVTHTLVRPGGEEERGGVGAGVSTPLPRPVSCRSEGSRSSSHHRVTFADDVIPSPNNTAPMPPPPRVQRLESHSPRVVTADMTPPKGGGEQQCRSHSCGASPPPSAPTAAPMMCTVTAEGVLEHSNSPLHEQITPSRPSGLHMALQSSMCRPDSGREKAEPPPLIAPTTTTPAAVLGQQTKETVGVVCARTASLSDDENDILFRSRDAVYREHD